MYFCETWVCDGTTGHIWGQGGGGGGGGGGGAGGDGNANHV